MNQLEECKNTITSDEADASGLTIDNNNYQAFTNGNDTYERYEDHQ